MIVKGVAIYAHSTKTVKAMLVSNAYIHAACPTFNLYPLFSKRSGGTDPTRAAHHTRAMYIKILCFVNNTVYFSGFTTQKYRLTAITPMVPRDAIENINSANPWNRQKFAPKSHPPWNRVATEKGIQHDDIRISLTASATTNMLASVRSLWFLYTAQQTERFPKNAATLITASKTVSVQTRRSLRLGSSWESDSSMICHHKTVKVQIFKFETV